MKVKRLLVGVRDTIYGLRLMLAVPAAVGAMVAAVLLLEKVDDGRVDSPADYVFAAMWSGCCSVIRLRSP